MKARKQGRKIESKEARKERRRSKKARDKAGMYACGKGRSEHTLKGIMTRWRLGSKEESWEARRQGRRGEERKQLHL